MNHVFPILLAFLTCTLAVASAQSSPSPKAPTGDAPKIIPAPDITIPRRVIELPGAVASKVLPAAPAPAPVVGAPASMKILGQEYPLAVLTNYYDRVKVNYVFGGSMTEPITKDTFVNDWQVLQSIKQAALERQRNELAARRNSGQANPTGGIGIAAPRTPGGLGTQGGPAQINPLINRERRFGGPTQAGGVNRTGTNRNTGRTGGGTTIRNGSVTKTLGRGGRIGQATDPGVHTALGRPLTPTAAGAHTKPTITTTIPVSMLTGPRPEFQFLESVKVQRGGKNALIESNLGQRFAVRSPFALAQGEVIDLMVMRDLRGASISLPKRDDPKIKEDIGVYNNVTITWTGFLSWLQQGFDFHGQIPNLPQTVLPAPITPQVLPGF